MKEQRSTTANENIQEILDAEGSASRALNAGAAQYFTPTWFVDQCNARLPLRSPFTVFDPQIGEGALVNLGSWGTAKFGCDIDNRLEDQQARFNIIKANCVKVFEVIDDLYPDLRWVCANANPPFSKSWKLADGSTIDATAWTWKLVTKRANFGFFIANHPTLVKLGIDKHEWVYHYETHDGNKLWKGMRDTLKIGVAFWKRPDWDRIGHTYTSDLNVAWTKVKQVIDHEKSIRPKFNIYLDRAGYLRTYLSLRSEIKLKISRDQILHLNRINECHPLTLTTEKEARQLLMDLVNCGIYTVEPAALTAIKEALDSVNSMACPIMPVTDFETVAYADEEEALTCIQSVSNEDYTFTKGKRYHITTGTTKFTDKFKRNKVHYNEETMQTYTQEHECTLSGQDRYIQVHDDLGAMKRFMDRPNRAHFEYPEARLWQIFARPAVKTIAESNRQAIDQNTAVLRSCEMIAGYEYYPGQLSYLARVAAKNRALVAGATGTGKTLMAISLLGMKCPERALIIAPQGTMRSSESEDDGEESEEYNASQWVQEINKFAPHLQIWEIFSYEDYQRICSLNGGSLPPGVYVSYYQAMFLNGARENAPDTWDDKRLNTYVAANFGLPPLAPPESEEGERLLKRFHCDQIGHEVNGIRCIIEPCLATKIGHLFDMVLLDEAQVATNLSANVTQMLIRLQPKFRYALTATPIPNIVSNLFSLMGWLAVDDWYKGERRNAAWPYAREDLGRFNSTFLSQERDFTQEEIMRKKDPKWRGTCVKDSPVISSPARLLKLLKPTMAFISKEDVNPNYIKPQLIDVRVPMGKEQSALYGFYLNRANIPANHPLVRARKQTAWLRNICADPAGFRHGGARTPRVSSNMNPKVIAILELTRDILAQGEQVIIINSRVGLSDTLQLKLTEAGVSIARIDSTIPAEQHAYQANLFKKRKAMVMLMGIKCAAAYSFDTINHLIVGSIEYSPGPLNQAMGRIDRVTNQCVKKIYCLLHRSTIEEVMFDVVAVKDDAATICLKGRRVPREFKPVDASEILAMAIDRFDVSGATPEMECETKWPKLRDALRKSLDK